MSKPSTQWRENTSSDEPERFAREVEIVSAIQRDRSARYGHDGRTFHRKQLLALRASFDVLEGLPEHAAHGLFAEAKSHDAWVRLSNGSTDVQADQVPDVRGFAVKVFGVDGPDARNGSPARYQDFLLIPQDPFGLTSWQFTMGVQAIATGTVAPSAESSKRLAFAGFATTAFHAPLPIKVGPYAARVKLTPPAGQESDPNAELDWGADLYRRLPLTYAVQLQFFVSENQTPIEDATKVWADDVAPYVTVATLQIPTQPLDHEFANKVEQLSFAPWNALEDHRPLGEANRARRVVMDASVDARRGTYATSDPS
jgi:hypothetical protein